MSNRNLFLPAWSRQQSLFLELLIPVAIALLLFVQPVVAGELGSFQRIEIETLDEEDFIFPDDFKAPSLNIVMLAMSNEQDNGTWQGDALAEWYVALNERGVLSDDVLAYHFSVMKVPFFIKGIVRGGMAKSYAGKIPLDQAGPIFIKDLDRFAKLPGIPLDGQPSIVLVAPDGKLLQLFKGTVSDEGVTAVAKAVTGYLQKNPAGTEGVAAGAEASAN